jgi:hypothetical protein
MVADGLHDLPDVEPSSSDGRTATERTCAEYMSRCSSIEHLCITAISTAGVRRREGYARWISQPRSANELAASARNALASSRRVNV